MCFSNAGEFSASVAMARCRGVFCLDCGALVDLPLESSGSFNCPRCQARRTIGARKQLPLATGNSTSEKLASDSTSRKTVQSQKSPAMPPERRKTEDPNLESLPAITASLPDNRSSKPPARTPIQSTRSTEKGKNSFGELPATRITPAPPRRSPQPRHTAENDLFAPIGDTLIDPKAGHSGESNANAESGDGRQLIDQLPVLTLWQNWKSSKIKLPNYLVKGRGKQLDLIAGRFVSAVGREGMPGVEVVVAGGAPNVANTNRPLRVLGHISPGHFAATDVTFRAEGTDLFVRFQSVPRTLITYLRAGLYVTAFLIIYSLMMSLYLFGSGAFDGWATDYAQKHSSEVFAGQDHHAFYKQCIVDGHYVFDNHTFVAEIKERGADKLLDKVVKEEVARLTEEVKNDQNLFSEESAARISAKNMYALMSHMGPYGPSQIARNTMQQWYGADQYFWWRDPDATFPFFAFFGARPEVASFIWYSGNVDFKECFVYDFGAETAEHLELTNQVTAAMEKSITFIRPWNAASLFLADPKLAMLSLGGPSTILAMLIGGGLYLLPMSILHWPCRALGWPTFEEFTNAVNARNAWVERVLSDMLMHDFGVQEQDRFTVMNQ